MALTKISTDGVKDDAVTAGKFPANAVGSSELADNAVDTAAIAADAVTTAKIAAGNVTATELATNSVEGGKITDSAITNAKIHPSAAIAKSKLETFVNNNANNRVITGSGTANSLEAEPNLTFDNTNYKLSVGSGGVIQSTASAGNLAIGGGNTNPGGQILFKGGNSDANIVFKAQAGTSTPAERMRLDSSGRLLLGTTTEGNSGADDLTIATTGTTGITIRSGTSNDGNLWFSDGTSGDAEYRGYIQYEHTNDAFNLSLIHI